MKTLQFARLLSAGWQWVSDIGQRPENTLERNKRLRLTNQVAAFTAGLTLPYVLFYAVLGSSHAASMPWPA